MTKPIGRILPILLFGLLTVWIPPAFAEGATQEGTDLILLVDDSQSVLPWYKDLTDYLIGPFVKDYLRLGDTFHLLSFGEKTQLEISRKIESERDIRVVLGRIYLLFPLEKHSDIIGALGYLKGYVGGLPASRSKTIVIVTTGLQNPGESSPWFGLDEVAAARETEKASASLRALGWPLHLVKLPFPGAAVGADSPGSTGAVTRQVTSPGSAPSTQAGNSAPSSPTMEATTSGGVRVGDKAAQALGAKITTWPGPAGQTSDSKPLSSLPSRETPPIFAILGSASRVLLVVLALTFIVGLLFFILLGKIPFRAEAPLVAAVKRTSQESAHEPKKEEVNASSGPSQPRPEALTVTPHATAAYKTEKTAKVAVTPPPRPVQASPVGFGAGEKATLGGPPLPAEPIKPKASRTEPEILSPGKKTQPRPEPAAYVSSVKKPGIIKVEMRVGGQNPHIGLRNVHEIHAGSSKQVGGKRSDFLIFLVRVPQAAGELHYDGDSCVFVPRIPELFPAIEGPTANCLGREIPMLSPRGYPLVLKFSLWEAPADKINRLLHCIEFPGIYAQD